MFSNNNHHNYFLGEESSELESYNNNNLEDYLAFKINDGIQTAIAYNSNKKHSASNKRPRIPGHSSPQHLRYNYNHSFSSSTASNPSGMLPPYGHPPNRHGMPPYCLEYPPYGYGYHANIDPNNHHSCQQYYDKHANSTTKSPTSFSTRSVRSV